VKWTIRRKILIAFAATMAILPIIAFATFFGTMHVLAFFSRRHVCFSVIIDTERLFSGILDAESGQRGFLVTGSMGMDQVTIAIRNIEQASAHNVGAVRRVQESAFALNELGVN
jgi:CHASE3 domain sensor protein